MSNLKQRKTKNQSTEIDINSALLVDRQVFLYGEIEDTMAERICKEIRYIDIQQRPLKKKNYVVMWINSTGGCVDSGNAIINTMRASCMPFITIVSGLAASMAGIISIEGESRLIAKNSFWMGHQIKSGMYGNTNEIKYQSKFLEKLWQQTLSTLTSKTKLTKEDLFIIENGELWLNAEEAISKGVGDKIM